MPSQARPGRISTSAQVFPTPAKSLEIGPDSIETGPDFGKLARFRDDVGRNWPNSTQHRPKSAQIWPLPVGLCRPRNWLNVGKLWPGFYLDIDSDKVGRVRHAGLANIGVSSENSPQRSLALFSGIHSGNAPGEERSAAPARKLASIALTKSCMPFGAPRPQKDRSCCTRQFRT